MEYIVILAGGLKSNGYVNDWVKERLNKGIGLYNKLKMNNKDVKIICCGGGTYHKPPILDENKYVIHESTACVNYLINNEINKEDIYKEWSSYDTIANAYFTIIKFIIPLEINKIHLITSNFHMERSLYLFNKMSKVFNIELEIDEYPTYNNMDEELLSIRSEREKNTIKKYEKNIFSNIKTKKEFTVWFHEKHNAYNNSKIIIDIKNNILNKSY
tara:strand:+ start:220 stop:864 length:645 start_codon:yes stop_codon:yes gene_type:complete